MKDKTDVKINNIMPCVPTRDLVVFPGMSMHFDVGRPRTIKSMKNAMDGDQLVFLCAQKDVYLEMPEKKDMFKVGTVAKVRQIVKAPDGIYRCYVEGLRKARLAEFYQYDDCYEADVRLVPNYSKDRLDDDEQLAVFRSVLDEFEEYVQVVPKMPEELYAQILGSKTPVQLFESLAFNIPLAFTDRQSLLEAPSVSDKLILMVTILSRETNVLSLERRIHSQVHSQIEESQREYYIREQIKALQNELGENEDGSDVNEIDEYTHRIDSLVLSEEVRDKLMGEVRKLSKMGMMSQEGVVLRNYLDTVLALPWNAVTKDRTDVKKAKQILDKDHYGMAKVKDRILENLAVRALTPDVKGQILCLVGPPGVGKTSVAKSVARALNRNFVRVSLGGVKDESDIRGHRKTYVGAMPGRIMNAMKLAGSKNPVVLLDEIDKMSNDFRGDPSSAMLEVLDSEQNVAFRDHYLEIPIDLSNVLFITTANTLDTIPAPLLDRMDVIELGSYTREEKFHIAKEHLVPKQLKKHGIKPQVRFANDAIYSIIDFYTKEAGVRKLERNIAKICRMTLKKLASGEADKINIKAKDIEGYLGARKYTGETISKQDEIGAVNGLAWTSVGGTLLPLEVLVMEGTGKIELTGSLGDVMKESAKIAVSLTRSLSRKYEIDPDFYKNKDIHIHAPEGAVPKDGPSAGVTMTTALVSALSGIPVRRDVAMTGEITLRGKVLPIGGLREKTMAAYSAGIKTVVIPDENKADMKELDDVILSNMSFVLAENIDTVLNTALVKPNVTAAKKSNEKLPSAKPRASRKPGKNAVKEI